MGVGRGSDGCAVTLSRRALCRILASAFTLRNPTVLLSGSSPRQRAAALSVEVDRAHMSAGSRVITLLRLASASERPGCCWRQPTLSQHLASLVYLQRAHALGTPNVRQWSTQGPHAPGTGRQPIPTASCSGTAGATCGGRMPTGTLVHLRTQYAHIRVQAGWQPDSLAGFSHLIHTASNAGMRAGPCTRCRQLCKTRALAAALGQPVCDGTCRCSSAILPCPPGCFECCQNLATSSRTPAAPRQQVNPQTPTGLISRLSRRALGQALLVAYQRG
jgi:hypothetical protein